jgi:hypothetical protein
MIVLRVSDPLSAMNGATVPTGVTTARSVQIGVRMWSRGIVGVVFCLAGLVWIAQGTNVMSNSKLMSGHGQYTLLGIVVLLIGLVLLAWAAQVRRRQVGDRSDLGPGSGPSL